MDGCLPIMCGLKLTVVCHSSWTTLLMPLQRKRAMKLVENWMGKKTVRLFMSFSLSINCDFALRICIILICSASVLYNTVMQSHHEVNKMGNDEGIVPGEIFTSVTDVGFVLVLFSFSPFSPFLPSCICASIIPLSFADVQHSYSVTNVESLLWFLPFAHSLETFVQPLIVKIQQRAKRSQRWI